MPLPDIYTVSSSSHAFHQRSCSVRDFLPSVLSEPPDLISARVSAEFDQQDSNTIRMAVSGLAQPSHSRTAPSSYFQETPTNINTYSVNVGVNKVAFGNRKLDESVNKSFCPAMRPWSRRRNNVRSGMRSKYHPERFSHMPEWLPVPISQRLRFGGDWPDDADSGGTK